MSGSKISTLLFLLLSINLGALSLGCPSEGDDGPGGSPDSGDDATIEDSVGDATVDDTVDDAVNPDGSGQDTGVDPSTDGQADGQGDGTDGGGMGDVPPGGECDCDVDCQDVSGQEGVCVFGICMIRASADCSAGGSQAECPDGARCWSISGIDDSAVCWPDCDTYDCAGDCDSDGSCVFTENSSCNPDCGSFCESGGAGDGNVGGACEDDSDCADMCYLDEGWVGGYCLIWGCSTPGAACGEGGICVPDLASDGTDICMGSCEGGCREGYTCVVRQEVQYCSPHCENTEDCPDLFVCSGDNVCVVDYTCSEARPVEGECPQGQVCDDGECVNFACDHNIMEPNESSTQATPVSGAVTGLQVCDGDNDWYSFVPSHAGTLYMVGVHSEYGSGNLDNDLLLANGTTVLDRSLLLPDDYHEENPRGPMDREVVSLIGDADAEPFYLHVYGVSGAVNNYDLVFTPMAWVDGPSCTGAGFSAGQCRALTTSGNFDAGALVPFPASHEDDPYIGNGVFFMRGNTSNGVPAWVPSSARFAKRELIMALRHAIHTVQTTYTGTTALGIGEIGMPDGTTPWGHPNWTHYYGSNVDTAYYIRPDAQRSWGNMVYRQICEDASTLTDYSAVSEQTGCCVAGSEDTHIVDIPRTALFLATLASTNRMRYIGVDTSVVDDLEAEFARLRDAGTITSQAYTNIMNSMVSADDDSSWVWHFHHMHVSMCVEDWPCY